MSVKGAVITNAQLILGDKGYVLLDLGEGRGSKYYYAKVVEVRILNKLTAKGKMHTKSIVVEINNDSGKKELITLNSDQGLKTKIP